MLLVFYMYRFSVISLLKRVISYIIYMLLRSERKRAEHSLYERSEFIYIFPKNEER